MSEEDLLLYIEAIIIDAQRGKPVVKLLHALRDDVKWRLIYPCHCGFLKGAEMRKAGGNKNGYH